MYFNENAAAQGSGIMKQPRLCIITFNRLISPSVYPYILNIHHFNFTYAVMPIVNSELTSNNITLLESKI